jgi:hypothetical protein
MGLDGLQWSRSGLRRGYGHVACAQRAGVAGLAGAGAALRREAPNTALANKALAAMAMSHRFWAPGPIGLASGSR